jgi:beta-lactam-binding protein with PASTA domain
VLDVIYNGNSVAEGAELPVNSQLTLIIGTSSNLPFVTLPDLTNLRPDKAETLLMGLGLNL